MRKTRVLEEMRVFLQDQREERKEQDHEAKMQAFIAAALKRAEDDRQRDGRVKSERHP